MTAAEAISSPCLDVSAVAATARGTDDGKVMADVVGGLEAGDTHDARRVSLAGLAFVRELVLLPDFSADAGGSGRSRSSAEGAERVVWGGPFRRDED